MMKKIKKLSKKESRGSNSLNILPEICPTLLLPHIMANQHLKAMGDAVQIFK